MSLRVLSGDEWAGVHADENALRAAVEAYLEKRGDLLWTRTDAASKDERARGRHVRRGWPDLTIILEGNRALLIELKTRTGRVSGAQCAILLRAQRMGIPATVCRTVREVHDAIERVVRAG